MKIKLYRSATVGIISDNYKLLTDPWLTDGEYYGSWSHYPYFDLKKNLNEINSYNGIYISHIHPDHCSEKTLNQIRKTMPIFIHKYHSPFLKYKLEKYGFKVVEIENGKTFTLSKDLNITIYAADNCDPQICYKFTGCANFLEKGGSQQIDSLAVINNNKYSILNINDCPYDLSSNVLEEINKKFNKIDVLLSGYGGAGPYPQCFENFTLEEKEIEGRKKEINFLNQTIKYIKKINPSFYLLFAGTYTLTGHLSNLQNLRGVPNIDKAYDYIFQYIKKEPYLSKIKPIKINPETEFDISEEKTSATYQKLNIIDYKNYIKNILLPKKLDYENGEIADFDEIKELASLSHKRYLNKLEKLNIKLDTDILLEIFDKYIIIPFNKKRLDVINKDKFFEKNKYVIYKLNPNLLKKILNGPKYAHWNNAEIGSHIKFYRNPNIFDRKLYLSMSYFHA
tara:strand:+ start:1278 stop:2633 length:1356 start_codon:yes stop_codon:yes gene_type:complete